MSGLLDSALYIACLRLTGRRCVVVGGGEVALEKVEGLLACDAEVTVIAPSVRVELERLAHEGSITWRARPYAGRADLAGKLIVIVATDDDELNRRVFEDAEARAMLVNVADVPTLCNFILPAIFRSGPIAIAISTAGTSPALAQRMRDQIAREYGEPYARLAELLNEIRGWAKATLPTYQDRKTFFESIVSGDPDPIQLLREGKEPEVRELIARARDRASRQSGLRLRPIHAARAAATR